MQITQILIFADRELEMRVLDDDTSIVQCHYVAAIVVKHDDVLYFRHQALVCDTSAHASRGQRGQRVPFDLRVHRGGTLQAGISGVPERDHALSRGSRGLLRERYSLRTALQSLAAALRQDLSQYISFLTFDFRKT